MQGVKLAVPGRRIGSSPGRLPERSRHYFMQDFPTGWAISVYDVPQRLSGRRLRKNVVVDVLPSAVPVVGWGDT